MMQKQSKRQGQRRIYVRLLLLGMLLGTLPTSAAYSQELIAVAPEKLVFPARESSGGVMIEGRIRGYGRYEVTWRAGAEARIELVAAADGMFYGKAESGGLAVMPTGERLERDEHPAPLVRGITALPAGVQATANGLTGQAGDKAWQYSPAPGRNLKLDTLQKDARGHVYFHDDTGTFHGVDSRGQAVLQLSIVESGNALRCAVTPAGDIGCSHPEIGLFGMQGSATGLQMHVDGIQQFPAAEPFVKDGTTYLPFRYLAEAMDAAVEWKERTGEVTVVRGGRSVRFSPEAAHAYINDKQVPLEPAVIVRENAVYVPVRFVAEALGAMVVWEGKTRVIQIVTDVH